MDDTVLDYPWGEYATLQMRADQINKLGPTAWAIEDQLNTFLESFAAGSLPIDNEAREKWLNNLVVNRQKKHRNRSRLLKERTTTAQTRSSSSEPILHNLIHSQQLAQIRELTTTQEWGVLRSLALDLDYKTIAQNEGVSVATLKTRVCRCRHRLKTLLAA